MPSFCALSSFAGPILSPASTKDVLADIDPEFLVPAKFYEANGIALNDRGIPTLSPAYETSVEGVYLCGDGRTGPATIVQAEADAIVVSNAISGIREQRFRPVPDQLSNIYPKRGILNHPSVKVHEQNRCLSCSTICEICTEVCPNRANSLDRKSVV